ncbi:hypothetical protein UlMin_008450 [Ulmus minor]
MNLVGVKIKPTASSLSGFTGDIISSEGILNLPVELRSSPCQHIQAVDFVLVDCPSPYNAIIGRPTLNKIRVKIDEVKKFDELDPREPVAEQHGEPVEELTEVLLFDNEPEKTCKIGSALTGQFKEDLIIFLREHRDVFAWSHEDMPRIDPNVIVHRLNIDPNFKPVKQKRRTFNAERYMAINTEVDKLLKAEFIEEANYPDWIANVVLVKKANGNWREHTAFLTNQGLYCYKVMPFGLKNAGATYQRLVNKMFKNQIGKTMEVYVDDMLVKSLKTEEHI